MAGVDLNAPDLLHFRVLPGRVKSTSVSLFGSGVGQARPAPAFGFPRVGELRMLAWLPLKLALGSEAPERMGFRRGGAVFLAFLEMTKSRKEYLLQVREGGLRLAGRGSTGCFPHCYPLVSCWRGSNSSSESCYSPSLPMKPCVGISPFFCLPHPVTWVLGLVIAFAGYGDVSFPDSGAAATECLWLLC